FAAFFVAGLSIAVPILVLLLLGRIVVVLLAVLVLLLVFLFAVGLRRIFWRRILRAAGVGGMICCRRMCAQMIAQKPSNNRFCHVRGQNPSGEALVDGKLWPVDECSIEKLHEVRFFPS